MGILLACALLVGGICPSAAKGKTILIPEKQKKENRFGQTDGNFSYEYKAESENLVLFLGEVVRKESGAVFQQVQTFLSGRDLARRRTILYVLYGQAEIR